MSSKSSFAAGPDHSDGRQLWQQIREIFPDARGSSFRMEQAGGDHLLLIVDEARVFRFPRPGKHGLALEIAVLQRLRQGLSLAVPDYDMVDPLGRFASYPLIPGTPLTPARFSALPPQSGRDAIARAGALLEQLHAIGPGTIATDEGWPRLWSPEEFATRFVTERLARVEDRLPAMRTPILRFLQRFRTEHAPLDVVLHGDLVPDHLLVEEHSGRLVGIIDFSDVGLGDPALDFLGFWAFGASAVAHAITCYQPGSGDPALLARSRNHFIRYRIDRLYDAIRYGLPDTVIERHATALNLLLTESSPAANGSGGW